MKKWYVLTWCSIFFALVGCQQIPGSNMGGFTQINPAYTDPNLTAAIENVFNNTPALTGIPIHVETRQGNVELSGYVKTIRQSDMAGDLASKVAGVKTVQNNLIVRK